MENIAQKLALVPTSPGVYIMRDAACHVIYIGKAKNLKNRLGSYFKSGSHDAKVTAMLGKVANFDYFVCKTEKDALGLEANLIKKHRPHYNILLKDNKSFPYIRIVPTTWPYLEVTRKIKQGGKYFGPYFNGIWAKDLLGVVGDIFGVRQCTNMARRPCLNHQMDKCPAPCAGKISREAYQKIIENIKNFLQGNRDFDARKILTKKMQTAADLNQFELAIRYRNGLAFLDKLKERTITQVGRDVNCDVFAHATSADIFCVSVLTVRAGKLIGIQNYADANHGIETENEMTASFIRQYYTENIPPDEIIAEIPDDLNEAFDTPRTCTPKRGYKKKLLEMAAENAREYIDKSIENIKFKHEFTHGACEELGRVLGTKNSPKKIECFDVSHMGGEEVVASMVVFIDGTAQNRLYRKFRIRHGLGNNDYQSMREVLTRRLKKIGSSDDSFGTAPDLIIVDGGKGQLGAAAEALAACGFFEPSDPNNPAQARGGRFDGPINFCALAKREEEIFTPQNSAPIILEKRSYALRLVQRIRDEAHRFAINYNRTMRGRKMKN